MINTVRITGMPGTGFGKLNAVILLLYKNIYQKYAAYRSRPG